MKRNSPHEITKARQSAVLGTPLKDLDAFNTNSKKLGHRIDVRDYQAIHKVHAYDTKLLLAGENGGLFIDLITGQYKKLLAGTKLLCGKISDDSQSALLGGIEGLYSVDLSKGTHKWYLPLGLVYDISFGLRRQELIACLQNHAIAKVDIVSGKLKSLLTPTMGVPRCMATDPKGRYLVTYHQGRDSKLIVWVDGKIGNVLPHPELIKALVLYNNLLYVPEYLGHIRIWQLARAPRPNAVVRMCESGICCLAVSQDGYLAAGDEQGQVSVLNMATNDLQRFDLHSAEVTDLGFIDAVGSKVLYSCAAGTMKFQNEIGELLLTYHNFQKAFFFGSSPDQFFPYGKFHTDNEDIVEVFEEGAKDSPLEKTDTFRRAYLAIHNDPKILLRISDTRKEIVHKANFQIMAGLQGISFGHTVKLLPDRQQ